MAFWPTSHHLHSVTGGGNDYPRQGGVVYCLAAGHDWNALPSVSWIAVFVSDQLNSVR